MKALAALVTLAALLGGGPALQLLDDRSSSELGGDPTQRIVALEAHAEPGFVPERPKKPRAPEPDGRSAVVPRLATFERPGLAREPFRRSPVEPRPLEQPPPQRGPPSPVV